MRKTGLTVAVTVFLIFLAVGYFYTRGLAREDASRWEQGTETAEVLKEKRTIDEHTKMVYQYYYTKDHVTKEQTEQAPVFLQGLNLEHLQSVYNGWQIMLFSPDKVILRCRIEGRSDENYILGEEGGYLAVFYEDEEKKIRLKEKTDIPLSLLPEGEALQLREGMRVTGEGNLAKVLADYAS